MSDTDSEAEKLETLFREIPAALALLRGPDFVFERANEEYLTLVGRADVIGRRLLEAIPEIKDQPFPSILSKVFVTGETFHAREIEARLQIKPEDKHLTKVYLDLTCRRILDREGKPYGIFVFVVNVTEKVSARSAIQLEKQKLEAVFANASASLAILRGADAVYENVNTSYLGLFSGRDIVGKPLLEALPELRGQKFPDLISAVYRTGVSYFETEAEAFLRRTDSGPLEQRYFDQSYIRIGEGSECAVLIQANDVTERVQSRRALAKNEALLRSSLKARSEFISIASHELKTPLTSLKLQTQTMRRNFAKGRPEAFSLEKVSALIDNNEKQIGRLVRLVDDMLDLAKIESGKLTMNKEQTDLCELVAEVYERLKEQLESTGGQSSIECIGPVCCNVDRFRIEQVVTNLLTNALRYGQAKPIHVKVSATQRKALISVTDQGMGIADEYKNRIFDRFERGVSANEISGLGLGLFISRQIVDFHHGRVWVESQLGQGSTFFVELPLDTQG